MQVSRGIALALLLLTFGVAEGVAEPSATLTFELVAEADWRRDGPLGQPLPDGRVLLYRAGDYHPSLIARVGVATPVPPGTWSWIAQGPGFVSTKAGAAHVPEGEPFHKRIVWPVVPACSAVLEEGWSWKGLSRVDIVARSSGAVYPIVEGLPEPLSLPAEPLIVYSVSGASLTGIDLVPGCRNGSTISLRAPEVPPPGQEDLLVVVEVPTGEPRQAVATIARGRLDRPDSLVAPSAVVHQGERVSSFFLDIEQSAANRLLVTHPGMRTVVLPVGEPSRGAREVGPVRLQKRRSLVVPIDYSPRVGHEVEELRLFWCGFDTIQPAKACPELPEARQDLEPGAHDYVFRRLDDGQYLLDAVVDHETIEGLGHGVRPSLAAHTDQDPITQPPMALREEMLYGYLLEDGERTAGTVTLEDLLGRRRTVSTDEALQYQLTYFGRTPAVKGSVPLADRGLPLAQLKGLFGGFALSACTANRTCRAFNLHSSLQGSGRLDLDLGSGLTLEVKVVDRETRAPVADAAVFGPPESEALHFRSGAVEWEAARGIEPTPVRTDSEGNAQIRGLGSDRVHFSVVAEGYRDARRSGFPAESDIGTVIVELEPDTHSGDSEFVNSEGETLGNGYLLAIGPGGSRRLQCSRRLSGLGQTTIPADCLHASAMVVFHPLAAITVLDGESLIAAGRVVVPSPPPLPPVVQILDSETGRPLADIPVELRFRSAVIGPNDLLLVATMTGYLPFYLSGADGSLVVHGVQVGTHDSPEIAVAASHAPGVALANSEPGSRHRLLFDASQ